MINVLGPRPQSDWGPPRSRPSATASPGCRSTTSASSTGSRRCEKGQITPAAVRRPQRQDRRRGHRHQPAPEARSPADQPALANAYRSGGDQQRQQPGPGRDHRPARPRPGRLPRRLPRLGDPRPARARARHLRQPGDLVRRGPADRRPRLHDRGPHRDGPLARRRRGRHERRHPGPRRSSPTGPPTSTTAARRSPASRQVEVPGIGTVCELEQVQTRYGTPRMVAGETIATDQNKCALQPLRRTDYYPVEFTDAQWAQLQSAFPTGVCDWSQPGVPSRPRSRGRPTRTRGRRHLRRRAARPGARRLWRRLDERRVRLMAQLTSGRAVLGSRGRL